MKVSLTQPLLHLLIDQRKARACVMSQIACVYLMAILQKEIVTIIAIRTDDSTRARTSVCCKTHDYETQ